jgi:hypothetical protein
MHCIISQHYSFIILINNNVGNKDDIVTLKTFNILDLATVR